MMIDRKGFFLKIWTNYLIFIAKWWGLKGGDLQDIWCSKLLLVNNMKVKELVFESTQSSMFYKENLMSMLSISIAHVF
jgi:hypothetical protein